MSDDNGKVLQLPKWEIHTFPWGTAVKRHNKWYSAFISPDAQEIRLEDLKVEIHESGIEFL